MNKILPFAFPLIISLFLSLNLCWADPAAFGLELGKATLKDIEANHKVIKRNDAIFDGHIVNIEPHKLGLEELKSVFFYCDKDGVIQSTVLVMNQEKFDDMFKALSGKYKLVSKDIPFVGTKSAYFEDGASIIFINAPHLSFEMEVAYQTKKFSDALHKKHDQQKTDEREKEKSLL